jgi:hypothetical protein
MDRPWRDFPGIWQWAITDADLETKVSQLGFKLVYRRDCGRFGRLRNFRNHAFIFTRKWRMGFCPAIGHPSIYNKLAPGGGTSMYRVLREVVAQMIAGGKLRRITSLLLQHGATFDLMSSRSVRGGRPHPGLTFAFAVGLQLNPELQGRS